MPQTPEEILSQAQARIQRLIDELDHHQAELKKPEYVEGRARVLRAIDAARATEASITQAMSNS